MSSVTAGVAADRAWPDRISPIVEEVPLDRLLPADSPRVDGEVAEHVRVLADTTGPMPPLVVHRPTMRVIDGTHRLRAAQILARPTIAVRYFDGSDAEAFALAVELNAEHGLPLTAADRTAAATRLVRSFGHWSDRRIAAVTRLSPNTVRALRAKSVAVLPAAASRTGRDGRVRPVSTAEQRRSAAEVIRHEPGTSLRAIARRTGISVNTVKDVAQRIEDGLDPVPPVRQRTTAVAAPLPAPSVVPTHDLLDQLRRDPAMRSNEFARTLLRAIQMQAPLAGSDVSISTRIPHHCRPAVRQIAQAYARMWARLAADTDLAG